MVSGNSTAADGKMAGIRPHVQLDAGAALAGVHLRPTVAWRIDVMGRWATLDEHAEGRTR